MKAIGEIDRVQEPVMIHTHNLFLPLVYTDESIEKLLLQLGALQDQLCLK